MNDPAPIPAFGLFGEADVFPDIVHIEDLSVRATVNDWSISAHRHAGLTQLFLFEDGLANVRIEGQEYALSNHEFAYIPENYVHSFVFRPRTRGTVVSLTTPLLRSIGPDTETLLSHLANPLVGTATDMLASEVRTMTGIAARQSPFRKARLVAMAHSLLVQVAETAAESAPDMAARPSRMRALDDLIAREMPNSWTASDYASALGVTTGHLSRLCREAAGVGASGYIQEKITSEACRLLAFTQLPVSEIGYRLGFEDPSYFSKRFKMLRGETPSEYRARFTKT